MKTVEMGRMTEGCTYRYHELRAVNLDGVRVIEDVQLGLYRLVRFAVEAFTRREVVIYVGMTGSDLDRVYVCSLTDFVIKFLPEPVAQPDATLPAPAPALNEPLKAAGAFKHGEVPS